MTPERQRQSSSNMLLRLNLWMSDVSMVDVAASSVDRKHMAVSFVKDGHAQLATAETMHEASRSCLGAALDA